MPLDQLVDNDARIVDDPCQCAAVMRPTISEFEYSPVGMMPGGDVKAIAFIAYSGDAGFPAPIVIGLLSHGASCVPGILL